MDAKILNRVQALLAKAASTEFPAEAESLYAKACELMAEHNISQAMLDHAAGRRRSITRTQIRIDARWDTHRVRLLWAITDAYGCQAVSITYPTIRGNGRKLAKVVDIFGAEDDIAAVTLLFPQLEAHMVASLAAYDSKIPPLFGRSRWDDPSAAAKAAHRRRHRDGFLLAYTGRIGKRLHDAHRTAQQAAEASTPGVALVLADRRSDARKACDEAHPDVRTAKAPTAKNKPAAALHAGWDAAGKASIGQREMPTGPRALGSGR